MPTKEIYYSKNKTCPECGIHIGNTATYCSVHNQKHRPEGNGKKVYASRIKNGTLIPLGTKRINSRGYVEIKVTHGNGNKVQNYKAEHRIIIEELIGRPLSKNELVHHVDGNKEHNNLKNLLLMTKSQHNKLNHFLGLLTSMPDEEDRRKIIETVKHRFPSIFS